MKQIFKFTQYFENEVLRKRSYLKKEWCVSVIQNPLKAEVQKDGRTRYWGTIPELNGRVLRVIVLEDGKTVHNAFPDRGFK